ncbi:MAG: DUF4238 domain-containing protein [Clostridiales bacterium]|nr:DUF4238 domain-containing protein [Clostridiales bacterium]
MANNPKYQHRIPKSYMKPWCSKEQSIYAYDKTTDVCRIRNIGNILGELLLLVCSRFRLYTSGCTSEYLWVFKKL